jgi:hypothetical protein
MVHRQPEYKQKCDENSPTGNPGWHFIFITLFFNRQRHDFNGNHNLDAVNRPSAVALSGKGRSRVLFTVPDPDPLKSEVETKKSIFVVSLPEVTSTIFLPLYRRQKLRRASIVAS